MGEVVINSLTTNCPKRLYTKVIANVCVHAVLSVCMNGKNKCKQLWYTLFDGPKKKKNSHASTKLYRRTTTAW